MMGQARYKIVNKSTRLRPLAVNGYKRRRRGPGLPVESHLASRYPGHRVRRPPIFGAYPDEATYRIVVCDAALFSRLCR